MARGDLGQVTGKPYRPGIEDSGGGKGLGDSGSRGGGGKKPQPDRRRRWDRWTGNGFAARDKPSPIRL